MRRGRGEGSIEELPSGKFRAILSAGIIPGGKRRRVTFTADTKREALAWLRERQAEQKRGTLADDGKMTLGEWLDRWLLAKKASVEPATARLHETSAEKYLRPHLGGMQLGKLRPMHVIELHAKLSERGVSASEQLKAAITLRASLAAAVKVGLVVRNYAKDIEKPKVTRAEVRPMTAVEARAFLAAAQKDRLCALWHLALDSGARPGELFALHWPDVETDGVFIRRSLEDVRNKPPRLKTPKTKASIRRVRLSPSTLHLLRQHRERMRKENRDTVAGPVFVSRGGRLLRTMTMRKWFLRVLHRADLHGFKPYDLRHTSATLLLSNGVDIKTVSLRLGHSDVATTLNCYIHSLPDMQERASQVAEGLFGVGPTIVTPDPENPHR
jgi:integrase